MLMTGRCTWCGEDPLYTQYHDSEWGVPVLDDRTLFEFLILEGAQAGLSWITVLRKREAYKNVFDNFDPVKVARFTDAKLEKVLSNPAIIRNRLKVFSARKNARAFLDIQAEWGSFSNYIWQFVDGKPIQNQWKSQADIPANTPLSDKISKDMKKRGFTFVGTTIIYAHMQATGMVNDHTVSCYRHRECAALAKAL
ncbi:DNA-3-methyladenine glycosylase I [Haliea sp. E17]|uniref:DNA-3-methyladenine glycosylase I n=1 Tax=Haliea sp. E17 TaxID=3401576 RepID=UPI003AAFCF80